MNIKWLGAALILSGCGGVGFRMASDIRRQEKLLGQLIRVLHILESELQYRLSSLPELCGLASQESSGILRELFGKLSVRISRQEQDDASACMDIVLQDYPTLPRSVRKHLRYLGRSLGRFDLTGQLKGLQTVRAACQTELRNLRNNAEVRQKSYQTLAICAGTSLVILFA